MAINHNISAGGMLLALSAEMREGDAVTVTYALPTDASHTRTAIGKIIRVEPNAEDPDGIWPYRVAVAFDDASEELLPLLEATADRISNVT